MLIKLKPTLLFLLFILIAFVLQSQEFKIFDNHGSIGITTTDDKGYVVIKTGGSSLELYNKVKLYVNELMVNPEISIVGDQTETNLKWRTLTKLNRKYIYKLEYITSVSFKDNKIKVEFFIQKLQNFCTLDNNWYDMVYDKTYGSLNDTFFSLYQKDGKTLTKFKELKPLIESLFDQQLISIENSLDQNYNTDW